MTQPNSKMYSAGTSGTEAASRRTVTYTYHPSGDLYSREWQRTTTGAGGGLITTQYLLDNWGRLQTINYPDSASAMAALTPDVTFTYDSAGRVATRLDGAGTTTYTWTAWGQASMESLATAISGVTNVTAQVERTFDASNRPDLLKAKWGSAASMTAPNVDYNFDPATGYLSSAVSGGRTVALSLVAGTAQWGGLNYTSAGTSHLSATRTLDSSGRTGYMAYTAGGTMLQSFDYYYDRDRVTKTVREKGYAAEETAWLYAYDAKGQVLSADKKFSTAGDPAGRNYLAGYQTQYTYDEAGNRLTKDEGGSGTPTEGAGVRQTAYPLTNALNQYENIRNPDAGGQMFDVLGRRSTGTETITVSSPTATSTLLSYQDNASTGLNFCSLLSFTAPAGSSYAMGNLGAYRDFTASSSTAGVLDSGKIFLPHPYEAPSYDADGNLRTDSRWTYAWDAENRLSQMLTRHTPSGSAPAVLVTFGYDGLSRRIWKKTRTATNPAAYGDITPGSSYWTTINHEAYLYDGWNLIMRVILNGSGTATARQSFVWGPDIASHPAGHESWQKAGGVGGLLMLLGDATGIAAGHPGTADYAPLMDRMGNVTGLRRIQPQSGASITNKALTSNVATLTIGSAAALYVTGQSVTVTGVDATFNGTWTVSAVTATTISYARTAANVTNTAVSPAGAATPGTALFAIYEYDAFGRELRNSGPASDWNPFRFSTKFIDDETGLVYYGYRYYHSAWGRWINRDPIGEWGGINVYRLLSNSTIAKVDILGLADPKWLFPWSGDECSAVIFWGHCPGGVAMMKSWADEKASGTHGAQIAGVPVGFIACSQDSLVNFYLNGTDQAVSIANFPDFGSDPIITWAKDEVTGISNAVSHHHGTDYSGGNYHPKKLNHKGKFILHKAIATAALAVCSKDCCQRAKIIINIGGHSGPNNDLGGKVLGVKAKEVDGETFKSWLTDDSDNPDGDWLTKHGNQVYVPKDHPFTVVVDFACSGP